jgi:PAS domain S-box-containing protein
MPHSDPTPAATLPPSRPLQRFAFDSLGAITLLTGLLLALADLLWDHYGSGWAAAAVLAVALGANAYAFLLWRHFRGVLAQRELLLAELADARARDARQALELSKLSWVAERTSNAVIITDRRGRIEWVNAGFTRLTEWQPAEVIGHAPGAVLQGPETDPATVARVGAQIAAGRAVDEEILNYSKSGRVYWVRLDIQPVLDVAGSITNFVAVQTDVSAQKSIELQLQRARDLALSAADARGQFIANTSHEIRTPMNGVLGMAELLLRTPLEERQRRLADTILRSGRHLLGLLNDVLDYSKMEAGRFELVQSPTDLERVLFDAQGVVAETARTKGLALDVQILPANAPRVFADGARLRQVLVNLLGNAVKFTAQGRIALTVTIQSNSREPARATFSVADTGIGIAPKLQRHIFEPFVQADANTATRYGGSGLGLAISERLVRLMGGELAVKSDVGQGATFSFALTLPLAADTDATETNLASLGALGLKVLVAEDYPVNQEVIREFLAELGCRMVLARNGREAIELFVEADGAFDVVLMDCRMPRMDGFDATRAIRDWERGGGRRAVPIIALTAGALATERERCAAVGMNGFIAKPVTLGELYDALAAHGGAGAAGAAAARELSAG